MMRLRLVGWSVILGLALGAVAGVATLAHVVAGPIGVASGLQRWLGVLQPAPMTGRPQQPVRTTQTTGQAPVYALGLSGGRTLGLYLDPGRAGPNEVHGTFADAQGRELELARAPLITARGPGARRMGLAALQEGPGHFYANGDFAPGDWDLDIVATTRTGEVLRARLTVRL